MIRAPRSRHDLHLPARATAGRAWSPTPGSKAPTARSIRRVSRDAEGMRAAVPPVLLSRRHSEPRGARKRPARSMRAANSAMRSSHAYGAAFDNPDLIVACVVGDGEAETGPLATSWHSNKFLNPAHDGAVLPILHLNGYKIANPTMLARISREELVTAVRRLRLQAASSSRATIPADASDDGGDAGSRRSRRSARSSRRARGEARRTSALADDRSCARRRAGPARRKSTA